MFVRGKLVRGGKNVIAQKYRRARKPLLYDVDVFNARLLARARYDGFGFLKQLLSGPAKRIFPEYVVLHVHGEEGRFDRVGFEHRGIPLLALMRALEDLGVRGGEGRCRRRVGLRGGVGLRGPYRLLSRAAAERERN